MENIEIRIMLHYQIKKNRQIFPVFSDHTNAYIVVNISSMVKRDILYKSIHYGNCYGLSDKGKFFLNHILSIPLPIAKQEWEIPKNSGDNKL